MTERFIDLTEIKDLARSVGLDESADALPDRIMLIPDDDGWKDSTVDALRSSSAVSKS